MRPLVAALLVLALPVAGAERSVAVQDFAFEPSDVRTATWETVTFRWGNGTEHGVTGDDGAEWCAPRTSGNCSRAFTQAGDFAFHCPIHPTMTGVVRVGVRAGEQNAPLLARFNLRAENMSALVDASDSAASATAIETFRWTWGDGNASEGRLASHAYAMPGVYTITLEVTDENGEKARSSREVRVPASDDPRLRVASSIVGRRLDVTVPVDGTLAWGDGAVTEVQCDAACTVAHEYRRGGSFDVTFALAGGNASADSTTFRAEVAHARTFDLVASGLRVFVDATRLPVYGNATYLWRWGDATNATGPVAEHTFPQDGRWSVTLEVEDDVNAFALEQEVPLLGEADARADAPPPATPSAPAPTPAGALVALAALALAARSLKNYK